MRLFRWKNLALLEQLQKYYLSPTNEKMVLSMVRMIMLLGCVGHLLEQATPEVYDPKFKNWRLEHLPIIPQKWQLIPRKEVKKQLDIVERLIHQADELINVVTQIEKDSF